MAFEMYVAVLMTRILRESEPDCEEGVNDLWYIVSNSANIVKYPEQ